MRVCSIVLGLFLLSSVAAAQEFRAGAARADITPPTGFPLWGYASRRDAACVGVRDPLQARALVLEVDRRRLALVSLDLGRAPTRQITAIIEAEARKKLGIDTVFLVASHTHHGPVLEMDRWPDARAPYVQTLARKLLDLLRDASGELRLARLGVASREVALNRNRHSQLKDRPVDRELLVLRIEDRDGKPIAHAVNFAAHPTILPASLLKFSADWPGAMASEVERQTKAHCLFLQGAAGNLSPALGQLRDVDEFGKKVAAEVLSLAEKIRCQPLTKAGLQVEQDTFTFKSRVDHRNQAVKLVFSRSFFPELVAFYEREYQEGIRPRLTTALLDGRIGLVGVSGEFFCEHSLHLKRRARLEHLLFLGYTNDYQQYFPTIEAAAEGGYGADAPMSPAEPGAGELMMNRALTHLWKLRGRLPELPPRQEPGK